MNETQLDWIFYLNLDDKIGTNFLLLDHALKPKQISLIPLQMDQLLGFIKEKKTVFVIVNVSNMRSKTLFEEKGKKIVQYLLRNTNFNIIHISSFDEEQYSAVFRNTNNYLFVKLPVGVDNVAKTIAKFYLDHKEQKNLWTFGKTKHVG